LEIVDKAFLAFTNELKKNVEKKRTSRSKLEAYLRTFIGGTGGPYGKYVSLFYREYVSLGEQAENKWKKQSEELAEITAEILNDGMERGEFRMMNPRQVAFYIIGIWEKLVFRRVIWREPIDSAQEIRETLCFCLDGLRSRQHEE